MGTFNAQSVQANGGVAWAKQIAACMAPDAVTSQIEAYQAAARALEHVGATLQQVKTNLEATWTGDAATAAQQSFQDTINHATAAQELIIYAVVPPLQDARNAQEHFVAAMGKVPDEQPVPRDSPQDFLNNLFNGTPLPSEQVSANNQAARTRAAVTINTLSNTYQTSAGKLSGVHNVVSTEAPQTAAFDLGPVPSVSASGSGAASRYQGVASPRANSSGSGPSSGSEPTSRRPTGTVGTGTVLSGSGAGAGTGGSGSGATGTASPPVRTSPGRGSGGTTGVPIPTPVGSGGGTGAPAPGEGGQGGPREASGALGTSDEEPGSAYSGARSPQGSTSESPEIGARSRGGASSSVPDETGFSDGQLTGGTGTGTRPGMGSLDPGTSTGDGTAYVTQNTGYPPQDGAAGEDTEAMMDAMPVGMGGVGGGYGTAASPYSKRARYLDPFGDEGQEPAALPLVASAFNGATDRRGQPVTMSAYPTGKTGNAPTQPGQRGPRPLTAKEEKEEECRTPAQRLVPPVIE